MGCIITTNDVQPNRSYLDQTHINYYGDGISASGDDTGFPDVFVTDNEMELGIFTDHVLWRVQDGIIHPHKPTTTVFGVVRFA